MLPGATIANSVTLTQSSPMVSPPLVILYATGRAADGVGDEAVSLLDYCVEVLPTPSSSARGASRRQELFFLPRSADTSGAAIRWIGDLNRGGIVDVLPFIDSSDANELRLFVGAERDGGVLSPIAMIKTTGCSGWLVRASPRNKRGAEPRA